MKRLGTIVTLVLLLDLTALLLAGDSPRSNDVRHLEQLLVGVWMGDGPCVGNSIFQKDGTYHRYGYGPGAGYFETGTWKIEWNALPPTLVLTPAPQVETESAEPFQVLLVKLDDKHLDFRWSKYPDSRIEEHVRGREMDDVVIRMNILDSAVQRYLGNDKQGAGVNLPPSLKILVEEKIVPKESLLDSWGREFQYEVSGKRNKGERPDIWTESKDGKMIGNWMN